QLDVVRGGGAGDAAPQRAVARAALPAQRPVGEVAAGDLSSLAVPRVRGRVAREVDRGERVQAMAPVGEPAARSVGLQRDDWARAGDLRGEALRLGADGDDRA